MTDVQQPLLSQDSNPDIKRGTQNLIKNSNFQDEQKPPKKIGSLVRTKSVAAVTFLNVSVRRFLSQNILRNGTTVWALSILSTKGVYLVLKNKMFISKFQLLHLNAFKQMM